LSAVDAYVGKSILDNCLLSGPLADRTRILVTHALHVLDKTDYIYVMDNGSIIEQGTYEVDFHCFRLFDPNPLMILPRTSWLAVLSSRT
jgi:ABC-type bacteriocin/lantibiotic exporter with double-glycine peptidase domain